MIMSSIFFHHAAFGASVVGVGAGIVVALPIVPASAPPLPPRSDRRTRFTVFHCPINASVIPSVLRTNLFSTRITDRARRASLARPPVAPDRRS
jgi:hypothetical protein